MDLFSIFGKPLIIYFSCLALVYIFRKVHYIKRLAISMNIFIFLYFLKLLIPNIVLSGAFPILTDIFREYQVLVYIHALFVFFGILILLKTLDFLLIETYLFKIRSIHIPVLMRDIVRFVFMLIVVLFILNIQFGIKPTALITTSAVLSAIIGFALQDTLSNVFAGISIHTEKPFSVDDWIMINELEGQVTAMNWRATRILTHDGNNIAVPNNTIAKDRIINFSIPTKKHAITSTIGFPYSTPPSKIKKIVTDTIRDHPSVLAVPPPQLRLKQYADYAIEYDVRFWIEDRSRYLDILDEVLSHIWYALKRNKIEIPFPIRTVYLHEAKQELAEELIANDDKTFSLLRSITLFDPLSDDEITSLTKKGSKQLYQAGETILKENESGTSFYLIESGYVSIWAENKTTKRNVKVKVLEPGEFFGEMSLLTGEKCLATVKTETDTCVFEIDKNDFSTIILKNPQIIEQLTEILTERQLKTQDLVKELSSQELDKTRTEMSHTLLNSIKKFFNIKR